MIPGEIVTPDGEIALNEAQKDKVITITVANQGDRPIQVGSHFHFLEVNDALAFYQSDENQNLIQINREDAHNPTRGMRLNIPAGTAVRFEPGDYQKVELVPFAGKREIYGFTGKIDGPLEV